MSYCIDCLYKYGKQTGAQILAHQFVSFWPVFVSLCFYVYMKPVRQQKKKKWIQYLSFDCCFKHLSSGCIFTEL